jgi:serine/threonine-protein kinase
LDLPREQRQRFLADACAGDTSLREELLSLLEAHDAAGDYFDRLSQRVVAPALSGMASRSATHAQSDLMERLQAKLAGTYRLERELAGGGMSRVFVAEDLKLKRRVVVKVLPPEMVPTAGAERFQREIELVAQLQHPHIIPLLTADTADGASYYTMPLIAGESLRDRLSRAGPLPVEDALRIWRDVLDALAHAHASGIVHRDIKPGNILLSGRNALVTDFGIARAIETAAGDARETTPGLAIGTPAYMAPEQAAGGHDVDPRVDIYQAGLVMYELLTGRLPFDTGFTSESLLARVTREPAPLVRPEASSSLIVLVMRCLASVPAERPQSAESLLTELDAASIVPSTSLKDAGRSRRAWRVTASAAAALALLVVVFTALPRPPQPVNIAAGSAELPAVAVLPLTTVTADPAVAALADGMTQELTAVLGRSADLRVIASTSVAALQDRTLDVRQIGDSLHVTHVLEGSLQTSGSRLRMAVRLVDARDGSTRWSETYDRAFESVFDVQADIARAVARELAVRLTGDMASRPRAPRHTPDIAAYEWYLRGTDLALIRTDSGRRRGIEYFERAIAIDSMYAAAYAGLANMYVYLWNSGPAAERRAWMARAEQAALQAVALDDAHAEALAALGWVRLVSRSYEAAEAAFERAIALNPNVQRGHEGLARVYMMMGRPAEQLAEARLGIQADPFSHSAIRELALALATNGRCEEALDQLRPLKTLSPPATVAGVISGQCYASREMWSEAIAEFQWSAEAGDNSSTFALAFLGYALARAGRHDEAARILVDLLSGREESHGSFGIATVYAGMREYDLAFAWLERAIDDDSVNPYIMHPIFADLHRDPRFARLRERMGVPRP